MTKSRGIGRGGARPNSGPKKRETAPPIERPTTSGLSAQELAKARVDLAIHTLEHIAACGVTEGARVSAAKIIIETAKDGPKTAEDAAVKPVDKWTDLDEARPN